MISLKTAEELLQDFAAAIKVHRLCANITQAELAARSNVSLAVLRKFERTGKISLESFLKLCLILGISDRLLNAVSVEAQPVISFEKLLEDEETTPRQRASSPRKEKN